MDRKTQEQRRLNKLAARKSARKEELSWSDFGAKYIGRANKPSERESTRQCDHIDGGKVIWIRRNRVNPKPGEKTQYMIPVTKGGLRCPNAAVAGKKCLAHLAKAE